MLYFTFDRNTYTQMNLKTHYILALLNLVLFSPTQAQEVNSFFENMPFTLLPDVEVNQRKDLLSIYQEKGTAQIRNSLSGTVRLDTLSTNYLQLSTERTRLELGVLQLVNKSSVLCLIQSYCGPLCDSQVHFFTLDWQAIPPGSLFAPAEADWFIQEALGITKGGQLQKTLQEEMVLMEYRLSAKDLSITQTYRTPELLDKETQEKLRPKFDKLHKIYRWVGTQYQALP